MLEQLNLSNVLFLDIETVPQTYQFNELDDAEQKLWEKKQRFLINENQTAEDLYSKAGIYAEFGKIICISVGFTIASGDKRQLRIKSFYGDDEKKLLQEFNGLLNSHFNGQQHLLCAHNGKEFDFPFIARRILINGLKLPKLLDIAGKKPWEINHLDTMELWKFGDYKNFTSLELLAHIFDIPTPKDDIDGSQVAKVYYEDKDLPRIVEYCQKDVITIVQLLLRYKGESLIDESNVLYA
jgi:3'-5' exonuclease